MTELLTHEDNLVGLSAVNRDVPAQAELLTRDDNLGGLMAVNRDLIEQVETFDRADCIALDVDSSESPIPFRSKCRCASCKSDARKPSDLDLPGYRLHRLKGGLKGYWSISISGNWRVIFRFEDGDAYDVDLIDYH